jgi:(4S)-4-hydroxy-5-phosphonooxypentane-2,3-dione isomerase
MLVVLVYVHVQPEFIESFKAAAVENASHSIHEPGVARFDVIQQVDDPSRFILVEVYRSDQAQSDHKETPHYLRWRDTVAGWMAEPRQGVKFISVYPDDRGW